MTGEEERSLERRRRGEEERVRERDREGDREQKKLL